MRDLHRYLNGLQGEFALINGGGPDACQGWLAPLQADYLTLLSVEGAELHLPLHHIRTIQPLRPPTALAIRHAVSDAPPSTFAELLAASQAREVRLNHAGPDVAVGIVQAVAEDIVLLKVVPDGLLFFPLFHVRSLYVPPGSPAAPPDPETLPGR